MPKPFSVRTQAKRYTYIGHTDLHHFAGHGWGIARPASNCAFSIELFLNVLSLQHYGLQGFTQMPDDKEHDACQGIR